MQESKRNNLLAVWIPILISIIGILVSVYISNPDNKRNIQLTNISIYSLHDPLELIENNDYESTWQFLETFSNASTLFHVENHSEFDVEIYGFYAQIQIDSLIASRILIPMHTSFVGTDISISPHYGDWEATYLTEKCTLKALSTYEALADIGETIRSGPSTWYLSSDWSEPDSPALRRLNERLTEKNRVTYKIRFICKDSFGQLYYSDWTKYTIDKTK